LVGAMPHGRGGCAPNGQGGSQPAADAGVSPAPPAALTAGSSSAAPSLGHSPRRRVALCLWVSEPTVTMLRVWPPRLACPREVDESAHPEEGAAMTHEVSQYPATRAGRGAQRLGGRLECVRGRDDDRGWHLAGLTGLIAIFETRAHLPRAGAGTGAASAGRGLAQPGGPPGLGHRSRDRGPEFARGHARAICA
jgi:hypothetical protein